MLEFFAWCMSHPGMNVPVPVLSHYFSDALALFVAFISGSVFLYSQFQRSLGPTRWAVVRGWLAEVKVEGTNHDH